MICIFHNRDLDGWMSAAIVKLKYPDVELIGWDYGQPIPDWESVIDGHKVIMTDISLPAEEMVRYAQFNGLIWIDHHISAIKAMSELEHLPFIDGLRNDKFAACELTWKYLFPDQPMPEIVRLLGRYDCFGHKGTDEELKVLEFQYGARANFFDPETCYQALKDWDANLEHSIQVAGYNIYNYLCTEAEQIYKRAFLAVFLVHNSGSHDTTYSFLCVNQERFNPINFGIDYHKDGHNGFICFHYGNGKWNFSMYNDNGDVDCSEICKMLGGGGHKGASGFIGTEEFVIKLTHYRRIELIPLLS